MSVVQTPPNLRQVFKFGEFEFFVRSGELVRNGDVLRLQYQPLCVLLVLLEYSGEVVTREEIRDRVWTDDSVRDFDNSLRVAVAKLRQALGDDPDHPQYIETLPRRGYRWLCPVTVRDTHLNVIDPQPVQLPADENIPPVQGPPPAEVITTVSLRSSRRTVLLRRIILSSFLWLAAFAAVWYLRPQERTPDPRVSPLTTYPGLEFTPSLSPDGTRVAFAWTGPNSTDPYRVYVKRLTDDGAQRVADTPPEASDADPVWTPDGRSILFYRRNGPDSGIYMAGTDGGPARKLTPVSLPGSPVKRARFDISPRGKFVVYPNRAAGQQQVALFLLDLSTLQSRQLTFPPPESDGDSDPAFSRDGKNVVFERDTVDLQQVYVMPAAGGSTRVLTDHNRTDIDGLTWTPDDRELLLGGGQLRRISTSSSAQTPSVVSYLPGPVIYPSLRGNSLVYSEAWDNANIWKLDLKSPSQPAGEPAKLIVSTRQQAAASFSPDGSQIAFQSDRSGSWEIWKANRDGSNAVQLTHFRGALTGTPRWSPDGKLIAFDSRASEVSEIYVVGADGGKPRQVTNNPAGNAVPAWSHDAKWLYYSSNRDGVTNIWKMPAGGGAEQRVTTNGGIYAAESSDGDYVYYSRGQTDSTLWRVAVTGGPEELVVGAPKPFGCSHWTIGTPGLYIISHDGDLVFYDFARRQTATVTHNPAFLTDWSLALSPDGHEIVWAQVDARASDLMLVENFR